MKVDITHLPMEIDFQTPEQVVAMEKATDQRISTKCSIFLLFFSMFIIFTSLDSNEKSEISYF